MTKNGSDLPKKSFLSNLWPLNCKITSSLRAANSSAVKMMKPLSPFTPDSCFSKGSLTCWKRLHVLIVVYIVIKVNVIIFPDLSIWNDLSKRAAGSSEKIMIFQVWATGVNIKNTELEVLLLFKSIRQLYFLGKIWIVVVTDDFWPKDLNPSLLSKWLNVGNTHRVRLWQKIFSFQGSGEIKHNCKISYQSDSFLKIYSQSSQK